MDADATLTYDGGSIILGPGAMNQVVDITPGTLCALEYVGGSGGPLVGKIARFVMPKVDVEFTDGITDANGTVYPCEITTDK